MKKLYFIAIVGIIAYGCSNSSNPPAATNSQDQINENQVVFENDLENALAGIPSWSNEKTIVKMPDGKAHSGEYVSKVDDVNMYSYAFKETLENINQKLPKSVVVNGWFYSEVRNPELGIVMDINDDNKSVVWKSYRLMDDGKSENQWHEFTANFDIEETLKPGYQIKIFAFGAKKIAYFDDIKVTFKF